MSQKRSHWMRIPVLYEQYEVKNSEGKIVDSQVFQLLLKLCSTRDCMYSTFLVALNELVKRMRIGLEVAVRCGAVLSIYSDAAGESGDTTAALGRQRVQWHDDTRAVRTRVRGRRHPGTRQELVDHHSASSSR